MTPRDLITLARSNPAYVAREARGMLLCCSGAFALAFMAALIGE